MNPPAIAVRFLDVLARDQGEGLEPCPVITRWLDWLDEIYQVIVLAGIAPEGDGQDAMFAVLDRAGLDERLIRPPQPLGGHRPEKEWRSAILQAVEQLADNPVNLEGYVGRFSVDRQAALAAGVRYRSATALRNELEGRAFLVET